MHLIGPWLTTTGKSKSKRRYRTADGASRARELQASWEMLLAEHKVQPQKKSRRKTDFETMKRQPPQYRGSDQPRIPSLPFTGDVCTKPQDKVYTGTAIKGIGTMHKSNAIPIFTDEQAQDIARMRR